MVWREFRVLFCHPSAPRRAVPGQLRATQLGILVTACATKGGGLWELHRPRIFPNSMGCPTVPVSMKGTTTTKAFLLIPRNTATTTD